MWGARWMEGRCMANLKWNESNRRVKIPRDEPHESSALKELGENCMVVEGQSKTDEYDSARDEVPTWRVDSVNLDTRVAISSIPQKIKGQIQDVRTRQKTWWEGVVDGRISTLSVGIEFVRNRRRGGRNTKTKRGSHLRTKCCASVAGLAKDSTRSWLKKFCCWCWWKMK